MAGHMGDRNVTTQNLLVMASNEEEGIIMLRGAVPGAKGSYVLLSDAIKRALPSSAPVPAAFKGANAAKANGEATAETTANAEQSAESSASASDAAQGENNA